MKNTAINFSLGLVLVSIIILFSEVAKAQTQPIFTSGPTVTNYANGTLSVEFEMDKGTEMGAATVLAGAAPPQAWEMLFGGGTFCFSTTCQGNGNDFLQGLSGGTTYTLQIDGLSDNTAYDLYFSTWCGVTNQCQGAISATILNVNTGSIGPVASAPTVSTTTPASAITATTATLGGNVTDDGGDAITARGVVYGTSANPTVGGSGVTNLTSSGTTGSFTVNATGLSGSTTYHYRAYATNSVGTSYGNSESFTTLAACNLSASISSHSDLNCNGDNSGTVTVSVSNGTANYDYNWSGASNTSGSSSASNTITGLAAGTYAVTVTDGTGCTATASETLTEPAALNGGTISF